MMVRPVLALVITLVPAAIIGGVLYHRHNDRDASSARGNNVENENFLPGWLSSERNDDGDDTKTMTAEGEGMTSKTKTNRSRNHHQHHHDAKSGSVSTDKKTTTTKNAVSTNEDDEAHVVAELAKKLSQPMEFEIDETTNSLLPHQFLHLHHMKTGGTSMDAVIRCGMQRLKKKSSNNSTNSLKVPY